MTENINTPRKLCVAPPIPWRDQETKSSHCSKYSLYEPPKFPNYPGTSNILTIPYDLFQTARAAYRAAKSGDREEFAIATLRLSGIPANLASCVGCAMSYGIMFNLISSTLKLVLPILSGAGVALCLFETTVHGLGLFMQKKFEKTFHLSYLSDLQTLLYGGTPMEKYLTIKRLGKAAEKESPLFKEIFGEQAEDVKSLFRDMKKELSLDSHNVEEIIRSYKVRLTEVARYSTATKLLSIYEHHLTLSKAERQGNQPEKLTLKAKALARRVFPFMVDEARIKIPEILIALRGNGRSGEAELGLKEGLKLANDFRLESKKKKFLHAINISTYAVTISCSVVFCIACPVVVPIVLGTLATLLAIGAYGSVACASSRKGWKMDGKMMVPEFLRERLFKKKVDQEKKQLPTDARFPIRIEPELFHYLLKLDIGKVKKTQSQTNSSPESMRPVPHASRVE